MTAKQPNAKEAALIAKMQKAVETHRKEDTRDGGYYYEHGSETVFQDLARELAGLIQEQTPQKTYGTLVSLAKKLQSLSEVEWGHANSIGFAFKQGLGSDATPKSNPFNKKNFPKL